MTHLDLIEEMIKDDEEILNKYPYVKLLIKKSLKSRDARPSCIAAYADGVPCILPRIWDRLENEPLSDFCRYHAAEYDVFPFDNWIGGMRNECVALVEVLRRALPEGVIRRLVDVDWTKLRRGLIRDLRRRDKYYFHDARRKKQHPLPSWSDIKANIRARENTGDNQKFMHDLKKFAEKRGLPFVNDLDDRTTTQ